MHPVKKTNAYARKQSIEKLFMYSTVMSRPMIPGEILKGMSDVDRDTLTTVTAKDFQHRVEWMVKT